MDFIRSVIDESMKAAMGSEVHHLISIYMIVWYVTLRRLGIITHVMTISHMLC